MSTIADALKSEIMQQCKCNRNQAIYICTEKTCPSHTTQPLYCLFCFEDQKLHPTHFPVRISKEVSDLEAKWKKLKEQLAALQEESIHIQKPFKGLINMCERLFSAPRNHQIPFKSLT